MALPVVHSRRSHSLLSSSCSSSTLPELNLTSFASTCSTGAAVEAANPGQPRPLREQRSPESRQLLLRARAALMRLIESSGATSDVEKLLSTTLSSIDSCLLSDSANARDGGDSGSSVSDCCRLVRQSLRLLHCDATSATDDSSDCYWDDQETGLVSWTPGKVSSRDCSTSESVTLLPQGLLEQFERCGKQWVAMQEQQQQQRQLVRLQPETKPIKAKAATESSIVKMQLKQKQEQPQCPDRCRKLIARPAASMFGHLRHGRHFIPRPRQQQQQQPQMLARIQCRSSPGEKPHQQQQRQHQIPTICRQPAISNSRTLLRTDWAASPAQTPKLKPRPRHQQQPVTHAEVRVMAIVTHNDGMLTAGTPLELARLDQLL